MKAITDKLVEKVKTYMDRYKMLIPDSQVVVGVSGGPDSMCLLHILSQLRSEYRLTILAVHINHGLRGEEADEDQHYVADWCEKHNISFHAAVLNVYEYAQKHKLSVEEAGRELRYAEFKKLAASLPGETVKIAVAQNLNDQAETILMRVFRGTGLDGLTGIEPVNGSIIRPLLETGRDEIEEYCLRNGIQTRIDKTNLETLYTRNKIRLECIPYIHENFNPGIVKGLVRMASVLKEDRDYLQLESKRALQECSAEFEEIPYIYETGTSFAIDLDKLIHKHPAIRKRVLRLAIEQVKGDLKGIEAGHIDDLLKLTDTGTTGSVVHLPHNIRVKKGYRTITVFTGMDSGEKLDRDCDTSCSSSLAIPGETWVQAGKLKVTTKLIYLHKHWEDIPENYTSQHPSASVQYFDYDKLLSLKEETLVRTRKDGDIISPSGMSGTKKLKEYFIDCKIPRKDRDKIPLIAAGKEIVWVTGFRTSERFKADVNTKILLRIEIQK